MASVNKVIIVGNLGNDPEVRRFDNGGMIATISVATTDRWNDRNTGEMREQTEWHRITFNNRLAEIVEQYLRKGSSVYVEGSIHTRKWQDQNGQDRYSTEIRANSMQMLGGRQQSGSYQDNNQGGYQGNQGNNYQGGQSYQNNNHQNQNGGYQQGRNNQAMPNNQAYGNQTAQMPQGNQNPSNQNPNAGMNNNANMNAGMATNNPQASAPQGNGFGTPNAYNAPAQAAPKAGSGGANVADDDMPF